MRNEVQVKKQIQRLEGQIKELQGALGVLKGDVEFKDGADGIAGTFGAEYATEWLGEESEYNIFDSPTLIED